MGTSEADLLRSVLSRVETDACAVQAACPLITTTGLLAVDGMVDHAEANQQIDRAVALATDMLSRQDVRAQPNACCEA